jgi:hypothetical protein
MSEVSKLLWETSENLSIKQTAHVDAFSRVCKFDDQAVILVSSKTRIRLTASSPSVGPRASMHSPLFSIVISTQCRLVRKLAPAVAAQTICK